MPNMAEPYGRTRRALLNKPGVLLAADHRARHTGPSWSMANVVSTMDSATAWKARSPGWSR